LGTPALAASATDAAQAQLVAAVEFFGGFRSTDTVLDVQSHERFRISVITSDSQQFDQDFALHATLTLIGRRL